MLLEPTTAERESGMLTTEKLRALVSEFKQTGFVTLGGVVPQHTCNTLLEAIVEDASRVRATQTVTAHEERTGAGHLQLGLRRSAPYVCADLIANSLVEQVIEALLGPSAWLGFYNGNVNLPGSGYQPVHFDRPFSWRTREEAAADGERWPPPTTTVSCSVALCALSEENGATEIFPGTHRETAVTQWPLGERPEQHPELIERWGPPVQMTVPAGGICFRDPRMWHRGVPNSSRQPRPMIGLTYHAARCKHWRGRLLRDMSAANRDECRRNPSLRVLDDGSLGDGRLVFDSSAESALADCANRFGINRNIRFVAPPLRVNHFLDAHTLGGARVEEDDGSALDPVP